MDIDLRTEPLGQDTQGKDVYLNDLWPPTAEVQRVVRDSVKPQHFSSRYADVFSGDADWQAIAVPEGDRFAWNPESTYVRQPTFFEGMQREPAALQDISEARTLYARYVGA